MLASSYKGFTVGAVGLLLSAAAIATQGFDHEHQALDALLQAHVTDGRVDYRALQRDRERLDGYLAQLAAPAAEAFDAWTADQRLAYWLNAYNAFVLATVAENYPIEGRTLVGLAFPRGSVWQIKGVWKKIKRPAAGGREVSLDQIENEIIRPRFDEPRIHFALVCASLGCPDLRGAYRAAGLDEQLDRSTRAFLNDPEKGVRFDGNRVYVSKIFKWFDEDFESFAGTEPCFANLKRRHAGPLSFIARYRTDLSPLQCDRVRIDYLDYDWHLNDRPANEYPGIVIANPDALDAVLDQYVNSNAYPFIYARLEDRQGRLIYEHAAVNDALLPGARVDGKSWIRIWSMSKIVTISVALDLVEDGVLRLGDPVAKYIPEFAGLKVAVSSDGADLTRIENKDSACPLRLVPVASVMTVEDLINHEAGFYYATTGIPCLDSLVAARNLPKAANSDELVDLLAALPLIQQPGADYFYGTNTTVLGLVAERATGNSLDRLVEERVTRPLGIHGLRYGLPPGGRLLPRISGKDGFLRPARDGELDIFGPDVPNYDPDHRLYLGGEGMLATADGYADFLRMLLNRGVLNGARLLEKSTVEDIASPHTQLNNPYGYNGYNLWVSSGKSATGVPTQPGLWIGGGYEGTHFWIDPERGFVGVIMSQTFATPKSGWGRDEVFRKAVYEQLRGSD